MVYAKLRAALFWIFVCMSASAHPVLAAPWLLSADSQNGLPTLSNGGAVAMSGDFVFWRKNWQWSGLDAKFNVVAPYTYSIAGRDQGLDFSLDARAGKQSNRQMQWQFDLNAAHTASDVIGGGISFKFRLDASTAALGVPALLPDNRGWSWGGGDGPHVEMRFDPPLPSVYFEPGGKSEIRAFFYKGEVPAGRQHYVATLTVTDDIAVAPTMTERYGLADEHNWPTNYVDWRSAPVDLSFLNAAERPAGKHGFMTAQSGKLVFQDGTPARFWGTNVAAYALFGTSRDNIALQAHRLAQLGFNLVRFDHLDSAWVVPNIFGDGSAPDTKRLAFLSIDKLDWWIKCLENEGIYVWLDLEQGRQFKPADGIDDFGEISKGKPTAGLTGYSYVNASIERAMLRFDEALLSHRNPYNGLAYKDDPGIVALLLTNENDVTHHFGNSLLPDKHVPAENALYMAQAASFADQFGLPKDQVWRSWQPGPSKLFLNDLEHRFDARLIARLRKLGVKIPIVTTSSWGGEPLSSLPALLTGDMVDVHTYGGADELEKNPVDAATFTDWMAAAHVIDRPLSVTEWNVSPFPAPDRDIAPLYVAATASYQGFDALMQFAYAQEALNGPGGPSNWESYNDPALLATMPAAALLYRRGDVAEARRTFVFAPSEAQLFDRIISPETSAALRTAPELGKLLVAMPQTRELPWLTPSQVPAGATVITDPNQSLIAHDATAAVSDTGQLRHDWQQGIVTVNTPRSQIAMGWLGGKQVTLPNVEIAVTTPNAVVAVQSLDKRGIGDAHSILISLGARAVPQGGSRMPFHSEPVIGRLAIRAPPGLRLYARLGTPLRRQIPMTYADGTYRIELTPALDTSWLLLKPGNVAGDPEK